MGITDSKLNISDAWKQINSMKVNIGDVWKDVNYAQINIGDSWKTIFGSPGITISGVSDSTPTDGQSIVITGTGFGSHALNIEWLGGASGNIESGTDGNSFSKAGWLVDPDGAGTYPPKYSTIRKHSHSQSIKSSYPLVADNNSGYKYNYGSDFAKIYATWWVYFDHVDTKGQWKEFRIIPSNNWGDEGGTIYRKTHYNADGSVYDHGLLIMCNASSPWWDDCGPNGASGWLWPTGTPNGQWVRVELYAEESSSEGVEDGKVRLWDWRGSTRVTRISADNITTRESGVSRWQYFGFQNYWSCLGGGDGTNEKVYIDDPYIQIGTRARVEIGNNATWANCTHREIQIPTAWASGEITINFNTGSFAVTDTVYLFVIDSNGNRSSGYAVTIA